MPFTNTCRLVFDDILRIANTSLFALRENGRLKTTEVKVNDHIGELTAPAMDD